MGNMKTGGGYSIEQRRLLLLRYLEGLLAEEESIAVERLLESSKEAFRELDELKSMVQLMRTSERVFCPEPWLISEFLETGKDPSGELSKHLRECDTCRQEAMVLGIYPVDERIPLTLMEDIRRELGVTTKEGPLLPSGSRFFLFLDSISTYFRFHWTALAAATAAVLLAIFLYPGPSIGPVVALSSITWDEGKSDLGGGLLGIVPHAKEHVTTILRFKVSGQRLSQEEIDSFYTAAAPRGRLADDYDFVPPARVKEVVGAENLSSHDLKNMLNMLRTTLAVDKVVLVTVTIDGSRASIQSELIETSTGNRVGAGVHDIVDRGELESKIGSVIYDVLPTPVKLPATR
jgi:hypothetical protein